MKKWFIVSVLGVFLVSLLFIVLPGKSQTKSYYSGDAIAFQNKLYVGSTNTSSLEIFRLDGETLSLIAKIKPLNPRFNTAEDFFDMKFSIEGNRLYVYAVSHYTIYKYELTGDKLALIKEVKNTYWEWYNRIDKFGNNIVTLSAKGLKIFNNDLEVINAFSFYNLDAPYNTSATNDRFVLSINATELQVYDRETRATVKNIPLNFKYDKGNRRAYQDHDYNLYAVDDYYIKKFDFSGKLLASFRHLDYQGFDVAASGHTNYVYFSNGVGVVKLDENLKVIDSLWTNNLGGYAGWAMGLKTVYLNGDKLVIFNNSNILVLDEKLNKLASVAANETADAYPIENLYLSLDKNSAAPNSQVAVSGGGFLPDENLEVAFDGVKQATVQANNRGRFSVIITVPSQASSGGKDIKVKGLESKLHYSISFRVE